MPRNTKDFKTCPECYGQGFIGHATDDGELYDTEPCYTCNKDGQDTQQMRDRAADIAESAAARANQERKGE